MIPSPYFIPEPEKTWATTEGRCVPQREHYNAVHFKIKIVIMNQKSIVVTLSLLQHQI